jgi:hypothetical protein
VPFHVHVIYIEIKLEIDINDDDHKMGKKGKVGDGDGFCSI